MKKKIEVDSRFIFEARDEPGLPATHPKEPYDAVRAFLNRHGVPEFSYCIGLPDVDQKTCFHFENELWVIYYSERGARTNASFYVSWSDAIKSFAYMLSSIYADDSFPRI